MRLIMRPVLFRILTKSAGFLLHFFILFEEVLFSSLGSIKRKVTSTKNNIATFCHPTHTL